MNCRDYVHATYMDVMQPRIFKKYLKQARKKLRESKLDYDAIAFCGMSGAVLVPTLAMSLRKEMILVRKEEDRPPTTHSRYRVEGYKETKRYIIVDDLVSIGKTVRYIVGQIGTQLSTKAVCVGVYCYITDYMVAANDSRIEGVIQSSVAKIEAADDPTVAPLPVPTGVALELFGPTGLALMRRDKYGWARTPSDDGTPIGTCAEITLAELNSDDAPSEEESCDIAF